MLGGFQGLRAADRRLRTLIDSGYLARKKYLYGMPYLYTLTHKGRVLIGVNKREDKIRVDQIAHDIYVVDVVIFLLKKYNLSLDAITSEKELHIKDGFGTRKHQPDFVFTMEGKQYAVEVELALKGRERIEKNIRDNYLSYDHQIWITNETRVSSLIESFKSEYSNIYITHLKEVMEYTKTGFG